MRRYDALGRPTLSVLSVAFLVALPARLPFPPVVGRPAAVTPQGEWRVGVAVGCAYLEESTWLSAETDGSVLPVCYLAVDYGFGYGFDTQMGAIAPGDPIRLFCRHALSSHRCSRRQHGIAAFIPGRPER